MCTTYARLYSNGERIIFSTMKEVSFVMLNIALACYFMCNQTKNHTLTLKLDCLITLNYELMKRTYIVQIE